VNLVGTLILARGSVTELFPLIAVANFLMIQSWLGMMSFEGPMWSISAEWAAYLCFPLFFQMTFGRWRTGAVALGLCVATLFALTIFTAWSDPRGLRDGRPLNILHDPAPMLARCFAEFAIGMLTFRFSSTAVAMRLSSGIGSAVVALGLVVLLAIRTSDVFLVLLFALFVITLSRDRGLVARVLSSPIVHALGVLSYAIYLVAPIVQSQLLPRCIAIAGSVAQASAAVPLAIALSMAPLVAFSYLAHRLIELPGRRIMAGSGTLSHGTNRLAQSRANA
jgi:peptidoglycan/LPS O-acetylase OafA/YrhL